MSIIRDGLTFEEASRVQHKALQCGLQEHEFYTILATNLSAAEMVDWSDETVRRFGEVRRVVDALQQFIPDPVAAHRWMLRENPDLYERPIDCLKESSESRHYLADRMLAVVESRKSFEQLD